MPDFVNYQVSNLGRVKSLARLIKRPGHQSGDMRLKEKILPGHLSSIGYIVVTLIDADGKKNCWLMHRLMLHTFYGPAAPKTVTRHLDGIRNNNVLHNIRYGTSAENQADRLLHGTDHRGEKHALAKLTNAQVLQIKKSLKNEKPGLTLALARQHNVSYTTIHDIKRGLTWGHLTEQDGT